MHLRVDALVDSLEDGLARLFRAAAAIRLPVVSTESAASAPAGASAAAAARWRWGGGEELLAFARSLAEHSSDVLCSVALRGCARIAAAVQVDMLDLAAGLKDGCSRLACQLRVKDYKRGEALEIVVPKESNNLFE